MIRLPKELTICPGRAGHHWVIASQWLGEHPSLRGTKHYNPPVILGYNMYCAQCLMHIKVPIELSHEAIELEAENSEHV